MGFWEKVLPGYKGYREREDSRNSDKLLREFLSRRLKEARGSLDEATVFLSKQGDLDLLSGVEKLTQTLSRVTDRLRYANYGFTGRWFGKDKIDVERLEKVHRFDEQLAEGVEKLCAQLRALPGSGDKNEVRSSVESLILAARDLDSALNERENILRAVGGEPGAGN